MKEVNLNDKIDDSNIYVGRKEKKVLSIGGWTANLEGDVVYEKTGYNITSDRLMEYNWLIHLMEKNWVDLNAFIPVYMQALKNTGRTELKTALFYEYFNEEYHQEKLKW